MPLVKKCRHARAGLDPRRCGCAWYADLRVHGVRSYTNVGPELATARALHARLVADKLAAELAQRSTMRLGALTEAWLREQERRRVRTDTLRVYRLRATRALGFFGDVPVGDLDEATVRAFADYARERWSPNTASQTWNTLRSLLEHAVEVGTIQAVPWPSRPVRFGRAAQRDRLTVAQAERVLAGITDQEVRLMAEFVFLTGLRAGELLATRAEDIEGGVLHVRGSLQPDGTIGPPKTASSVRQVALSPRARDIVGTRPTRGRLWPMTQSVANKRLAKEAPGIGWHAFRHANATLRAQAGQDVRTQQAQLGHSAVTMTLRYGRPAESSALALDRTRVNHAETGV